MRSCSGAKEPLMWIAWSGRWSARWARPIRIWCARKTLIEETLRLEETRFRKTLERGLAILDEKSASLKKGDMFDGDRLHAVRHLRFPAGPDAGRAEVARHRRRPGLVHRRDGAAEGQGARVLEGLWRGGDSEAIWFPLREKLGATEFLGYETESAEGVVVRAGEGRQEVARPQGRRHRRDPAEPDAVLRASPAARSATPAC